MIACLRQAFRHIIRGLPPKDLVCTVPWVKSMLGELEWDPNDVACSSEDGTLFTELFHEFWHNASDLHLYGCLRKEASTNWRPSIRTSSSG